MTQVWRLSKMKENQKEKNRPKKIEEREREREGKHCLGLNDTGEETKQDERKSKRIISTKRKPKRERERERASIA